MSVAGYYQHAGFEDLTGAASLAKNRVLQDFARISSLNEMMHNCPVARKALTTAISDRPCLHESRVDGATISTEKSGNEDPYHGLNVRCQKAPLDAGGYGRSFQQGIGRKLMNAPKTNSDQGPLIRESGQVSIIFFAYHFFPSREVGARRMSALARHFRRQGRSVAVVSAFAGLGSFNVDNSAAATLEDYDVAHVPDRKSTIDAILVNGKKWLRGRVPLLRRAKHNRPVESTSVDGHSGPARSALHRALFSMLRVIDDKKGWSMRASRRLRSLATRHTKSVIVVSGPPISPLFAAVFTARKLKLPIVVDLRDPITDMGAADAARSRSRRWAARRFVEQYVVANADAIVTTTPGLRDRLRSRYPAASARVSCIFNGFDGEMTTAKLNTGNHLSIVFAGELYLNRNPFPFLEAVDRLLNSSGVDETRVRVVFAGQCEIHGGVSVREWSSTRPCGRVLTIHPPLDAARLKELYENATLLLNFAEGQPIQVPAKTFELLSLGREILVACEPYSDTSKVIAGIDGVFGVQLSETERLDYMLRSFYRRHAVEGRMSPPAKESVLRYSRAIQNEHYRTLIDRVGLGIAPHVLDGG
jgi:hypothetical protein